MLKLSDSSTVLANSIPVASESSSLNNVSGVFFAHRAHMIITIKTPATLNCLMGYQKNKANLHWPYLISEQIIDLEARVLCQNAWFQVNLVLRQRKPLSLVRKTRS